MKVAFITDVMYPMTVGGSEKLFWEIAKRLYRKIDLKVYTAYWLNSPTNDERLLKETLDPVFVCSLERLYRNEGRSINNAIKFSFFALVKLLKDNERYDILHLNQSPILHHFTIKFLRHLRQRQALLVSPIP